MAGKNRSVRWDKLDNTAHLFPVIAGDSMTNTYRLSAELKEIINGELLQQALDKVLPKFDLFNVRMRTGFFWYYFEENNKKAPKVVEENTYPCRFIRTNRNRSYLFRVTYYKKRINLEVFHVLTDGMGGINFLRELTYQYIRLAHPELELADSLTSDTSMNMEDGFIANYERASKKTYQTSKAYELKGDKLPDDAFGVIRGRMNIAELKKASHSYGMTINEYLVSTYVYSIYKGGLHGHITKRPIRVAVPVNLRPYFDSVTTKNFFVMISASFLPESGREYTYDEVINEVRESMRSQMTKEHLKDTFSYNVAKQSGIIARLVPIWLKRIAIKAVYTQTALANTTTMTNVGNVGAKKEYLPFIDSFYGYLAMSKGQLLKATVCSFGDDLSVTFSSVLEKCSVQREFFKALADNGVTVTVETNGVY
ncbi:MAG: hypothetical protein IKQ56_02130 [Lachnospiraceae bacterium]|nr:hypothetical protein [Lachnospiraceae bacterium]